MSHLVLASIAIGLGVFLAGWPWDSVRLWRWGRRVSRRIALLPVVGALYERWLDWRIARIDRTGPRFKNDCSVCGQRTADEARTYLRELPDGSSRLARHEPACVDCALEDSYEYES